MKHIRQEDNHDSELTSSSADNEIMLTRSAIPAIDLKKKCMFCDKTNYKGNKTLIRVEHETFWKTLDKIAKEKNDHDLRLKLEVTSVNYPHWKQDITKTHVAYSKRSVEKMTYKNHCDEAFSNFTPYLDELLNDFRAIKLSSLLTKYIDLLVESGLEKDTANNYVAQRLKDRIIKHYGKKVTFAQSSRKDESQFVYNSNIDIQNVINVASELKNINKPENLELLTDKLHEEIVKDYKSNISCF